MGYGLLTMIDTPQSIAAGRNTYPMNGHVFILTMPLIIGVEKSNSGVLPTMTVQSAILSQTDNGIYRSRTDVYGACHTNAAWRGNVAEAD